MVRDAKNLSDPQELEKIFESYLTDKSIKKITQRKTGETWKEKIHKKEKFTWMINLRKCVQCY